jgi:hypothetical protein
MKEIINSLILSIFVLISQLNLTTFQSQELNLVEENKVIKNRLQEEINRRREEES